MLRKLIPVIVLIINAVQLSAQLSQGGLPASKGINHTKSAVALPGYKLSKLNRAELLAEDRFQSVPFRYAIVEDVSIDIIKSGRKDSLPNGAGYLWRFRIAADSASSIQLFFQKFIVPEGATLFIYNDTQSQLAGAFTSLNMRTDRKFVVADFSGDHLIVEYFEPADAAFRGSLILGGIGQAYKDVMLQEKSGDSYININCPEGKDLQLQKHAVCKITFTSNKVSYLCTGALINNARQDGSPYFLTASHCISDSAEAKTLVAYFNYEIEGCSGTTKTPLTLSGSNLLSTASGSDYTLLRLNDAPLPSYQPYYAGWNANNTVTNNVSGIHHPEGLSKKLAIDHDSIASNALPIQWEGNSISPVGSHWQVNFDEGLTAGGSSGSPLFNAQKQIIGQLHGGDAIYDLYGKISYSWTHTSGGYQSLKSYLDPDNTGVTSLNGYIIANTPPDAFTAIPVSQVCLNAPVQFTDYSAFEPYTRQWSFSPATYIFVEGTSSSPNPVVQFLTAANYSVKLRISNAAGTDSVIFSNGIRAGNTISVNVAFLTESETCLCDFDHFSLRATGAEAYLWEALEFSDRITLDDSRGDTLVVSAVAGMQPDSSYAIPFRVIGTQATCSDTATISYNLVKPVGDNIMDAILLDYGQSATYSNNCATIETGEPEPPHYSCTTQYSWCDEYGTGENIVENSLWFKFIAGSSGYVSIASQGFDNEIALYEADSENDILNENFTILGANDDRSTADYNPLIRSESVIPGKTYWIQVDGSGGGSTGKFYLKLIAITVTGTGDEMENPLIIYPQPAGDFVYFQGEAINKVPLQILVYTASGTLVQQLSFSTRQESISLDVSAWKPGVYFARIQSESLHTVARIVKY